MVPPPATGAAPGLKLCGGDYGCQQYKPLDQFGLRQLRCKAHRQSKTPGVGCQPCADLLTKPSNRQPRCKPCDVRRKSGNAPVTAQPLAASAATPNGAVPVSIPARPQKAKAPRRRLSRSLGQPAIQRVRRQKFKGPPTQGPQLVSRKAKGNADKYVQAQPTEIMRMVTALFTREKRIKAAEDLVAMVQTQVKESEATLKVDPSIHNQETLNLLRSDLDYATNRLGAVRAWRDFTSQKIRLFLDHALSTTPYRKIICHACRQSGKDIADPACKSCNGIGMITKDKENHFAKAAVEKLKHLKKVLPVTELCAKIKAQTSEADAAYAKLLQDNMGLVKKFSNENQTLMEKDDAEQGAMMGILDAAVRFNPAKPEHYMCSACKATAPVPVCDVCNGEGEVDDEDCTPCAGFGIKTGKGGMTCVACGNPRMMLKTSTADFKTYAYNWAYRNSRARKDTDKRAGVYAPSIDAMIGGDDEQSECPAVVAGSTGSVGKFAGKRHQSEDGGLLTTDLKHQVAQLADPQQRAVINYHLAGLSLTEIAQALGISKATCSKIRDTAYGILRTKLSGYREGNVDGSDADE